MGDLVDKCHGPLMVLAAYPDNRQRLVRGPAIPAVEERGWMNLILLILRLLLGPLAPRFDDAVPLAVRRDGRVEQRLQRPSEETPVREPAASPWSVAWKALLRAVCWCGRLLGLCSRPGSG